MTHATATREQGHPHKWLVLVTVSLGLILAILDISVVNIAIPALIRDLGTTVSGVSWVINGYNITQAVLLLSFGRLADRYGQRRVFLFSLSLFTLFSLACGFSANIDQLIGFRLGQAVGAAGIVPISLIILLGAFPPHQHGLATGLWGAIGTVAAVVGPPVGGLFIEYASWNWIFFMNVPVGIVAVVLAILVVPEIRRDTESASLDLGGIGLSAAALFCLTLGIIQGNTWRWASPTVVGLLVGSAVLLAAFLLWQKRSRSPMLDLRLFRIRAFSAANAMGILSGVGMGGAVLLFVLFMVNVLGYTELRAAIVMIPMAAVAVILTPFAGRLVDTLGPRQLAAAGTILFAIAFALLSQLRADSGVWSLAWRQIILGIAMSLHMPALTAAGLTSLPMRSSGVGSGMIGTSRQFGMVLGVALLLAIYGHTAYTSSEATVAKATAHVTAYETLTPVTKERVIDLVRRNAERDAAAAAAAGGFFDPAAGLSEAMGTSVDTDIMESIRADLVGIARAELGKAFMWPFLVAALLAIAALPLAFMLGRRLGDHRVRE